MSAKDQIKFNGLHHLALVCKDMERTVDFYTNVLGMTLKKGSTCRVTASTFSSTWAMAANWRFFGLTMR